MNLPGAKPLPVQIIRRKGSRFHAVMPHQKEPVVLAPGIHVHLAPGAQYDPGAGGAMVDIHKAYHHAPHTLPPALLKMIEDAVQRFMEQQGMHERLAATAPPVGASPLPGSGAALGAG